MLNLIADYKKPDVEAMSKVSGIPKGWKKSLYNQRHEVADALDKLISDTPAKIIALSYSNGGFFSSRRDNQYNGKIWQSVKLKNKIIQLIVQVKNLRDKEGNLTRDLKSKRIFIFLAKKVEFLL